MTNTLMKHSQPHRLEAVVVRTPYFCAHCGRLIPIGGNASDCLRCLGMKVIYCSSIVECEIYLHKECEMYLAALCGLRRKDAIMIIRAFFDQQLSTTQPEQPIVVPEVENVWPAYNEDDFEYLHVIGKGNFGKVMLVKNKESGRLFALKILKKSQIIDNDELDSVVAEQRVLMLVKQEACPFLVGCQGVFQSATRLFFVMEFVGGGDLMFHIQSKKFSEDEVKYFEYLSSRSHINRFLAAEVFLALDFLHKRAIIYRDLKLDNILLALDGHIKLADYGLCKFGIINDTTTSTFCGTPEFMAPEILQEKPYGKAVDWWAFGVLLYELLFSRAPFHGRNEHEVFKSILTAKIGFPRSISSEAEDIIQRLLVRNPIYRLGAGKDGAEAIKRHSFFDAIDWIKLQAKKVEPLFKPFITTPMDISNFEGQFTSEIPILTPSPSFKIPTRYGILFDNLSKTIQKS